MRTLVFKPSWTPVK